MPSDTVVENFDIFEQAVPGCRSGFVFFVMNQFFLQGGKEGFHRCFVPAIPLTAHRTRDAVFCEQALVMLAGVLHTAVGMRHEVGTGTLPGDRHCQGINHEATVDRSDIDQPTISRVNRSSTAARYSQPSVPLLAETKAPRSLETADNKGVRCSLVFLANHRKS